MYPIQLKQQLHLDEIEFSIEHHLNSLKNNIDNLSKVKIKEEVSDLCSMFENLIKVERDLY